MCINRETAGERGVGKMKRWLAALLCVLLLPCGGCAFSPDAVDALLEAPRLSERQTEIYNALTGAEGRNLTLKYPKEGDNRSAFLLHDLDGAEGDEALAFYQSQAADAYVHIFVVDTDEENEWHGVANIAVEGNEIDKVVFANLFGSGSVTLVGAQGENKSQRSLSAYQYLDGNISMIYTAGYTAFSVTDIDADGLDELFLFRLSDEQDSLFLTVVQEENGKLTETDELEIGSASLSLLQMRSGQMPDGRQALYVDYVQGAGSYYTELYYWEDGRLIGSDLRRQTARTFRQGCRDIAENGVCLIPRQQAMTAYPAISDDAPYWVFWQQFDPAERRLSTVTVSYLDLAAGYALLFTEEEAARLTFRTVVDTGETVCTEAATGGEVFRLQTFRRSERDEMPYDYAVIGSAGQYLYAAQVVNRCSSDLATDVGRLSERFYSYN